MTEGVPAAAGGAVESRVALALCCHSAALAVRGARADAHVRNGARIIACRTTEACFALALGSDGRTTTHLITRITSKTRFAVLASIASEIADASTVERRILAVTAVDAEALVFAAGFVEDPSVYTGAVATSVDAVAARAVTRAVEDGAGVVAAGARVTSLALTEGVGRVTVAVAAANCNGTTDAGLVAVGAGPAVVAGARAITGTTIGASAVFTEAVLSAAGTVEIGLRARTAHAVGIKQDFAELTAVVVGAVASTGHTIACALAVAHAAASSSRPHTTGSLALFAPVPIVASIAAGTFEVALGGVVVTLAES